VRDTVQASLGLVRWQAYADMTADLFDRLAEQAIDEAQEAAATEGYFSAAVDIAVDRSVKPAKVTVHVKPGSATRIHDVDVEVTGAAASDPGAGAASIRDMRTRWGLPVGAVFRQSAWDDAKNKAVARLAADRYAAAQLTHSQADIDPATQRADLDVRIDSGPPFHFGPIRVTGLRRYDASLVEHYSTIEPGSPYSLDDLDQYVRRLTSTGYFASVHAAIDTDPAKADDAPVTVSVIEAPPKRIEAGIGFSTDTRIRANLSYGDVDFLHRALQFSTDLRLEQKLQSAAVQLVRPPDANGWSLSGRTEVQRTDIAGLITQTASTGVRRISIDERNQWQYGGAFLIDEQRPSGAPSTSAHALYTDLQRTWRRVDDLVAPTRGTITDLQVGVGIPGASTKTFGRVIARFAAWYPIDPKNELTGRLEGGAVIAGSREGVPSSLLFRTGGDQTVRGYAFDSLGVHVGDAVVPGRYFALGSIEAIHWIRESIGIATFVDAGDAFDSPGDFRLAVGYGVGARVRTPVGPLRLDLAYGERTHEVRLHFSVGLAF
jgi:translocation and assembly module TamA